jgi:hypothetical protein
MAFTEAQRVKIRKYLGYAGLYLTYYSKLESAITTVQSEADGGSRPDGSTESLILATIAELEAIDTKLTALHEQVSVGGVDEIKLDPGKGIFLLRSEGRRKISVIANALSCAPLFDYYSGRQLADFDCYHPWSY